MGDTECPRLTRNFDPRVKESTKDSSLIVKAFMVVVVIKIRGNILSRLQKKVPQQRLIHLPFTMRVQG